MINSKGMSGFSTIVFLVILGALGYIGYQIVGIHLAHASLSRKVESVVELGYGNPDYLVFKDIQKNAQERKIELNPDSIIIDRSIPDSFRIYIAYTDSSSIFDIFYYKCHFVIDKIGPIKAEL